ncbi:aldehyde dehydrogenase 1A1-like [Asterias amurensis]|uniref:aldehyde dehydrogenase 1A1-like n=1 Tax=Asterias amurensis TaxID=7602 RepID=UPI003AB61EFC
MAIPEIKYTQLFINNEFVNSVSGKTFPTINPTTGEKICDIQEGDKADIDLAVKAAKEAFKLGSPWRTMDASKRAEYLMKLADLLQRDVEYLASLETVDNGMIITKSRRGVIRAAGMLRYYAGWADKIHGKTIPLDGKLFCYTRYEPKGVIGAIIPWNFPIQIMIRKMATALACGNTIVVKPAEQTPLTALCIATLVKEAGFPAGVFNIVPGYGPTAGASLSEHMNVDMVTFTGSVQVGKLIQQASGRSNLKHVALELGGKSPNVVFADADLDYAVEVSHGALFSHSGQVCCAATRTYVQEGVYDEFVKKSAERASKRIIGNPYDEKTESGPIIDTDQVSKIMELIESGKNEGAKLQCGGKRIEGKGNFIESTVFSEVTDDMRIAREEIFGPVQQIIKFKTLEEVIDRANDTEFGLAAGVITKDIDKALAIANSVRAGSVWINTYGVVDFRAPFGGYNMSGVGREGGEESLSDFCEIKTVVIKVPEKNS